MKLPVHCGLQFWSCTVIYVITVETYLAPETVNALQMFLNDSLSSGGIRLRDTNCSFIMIHLATKRTKLILESTLMASFSEGSR